MTDLQVEINRPDDVVSARLANEELRKQLEHQRNDLLAADALLHRYVEVILKYKAEFEGAKDIASKLKEEHNLLNEKLTEAVHLYICKGNRDESLPWDVEQLSASAFADFLAAMKNDNARAVANITEELEASLQEEATLRTRLARESSEFLTPPTSVATVTLFGDEDEDNTVGSSEYEVESYRSLDVDNPEDVLLILDRQIRNMILEPVVQRSIWENCILM